MRFLPLIAFLFITLFTTAQPADIWVTEVANMPMAISNNAVVEGWANDTGYVYSFGGIDSTKIWSGISKKSFRYNIVSDVWDTIPDLPNADAVIASGASWVDSNIYIMGGYQVLSNGNEISSNIVNRFDPRTNTYLSNGAPIPVAIDDHVQAVWNDSLIYVITGWSNTGNVPNVQIYDPANDNWLTGTAVPNNNIYKAFGASGTIIGNTIYYHGGASTAFNFPGQSTKRIGQINPGNPTQITWSTQITPHITYRAACTSHAYSPWWIGGSEVTYNYNGIAYNGSGGVQPRTQFISDWGALFPDGPALPMDLRGIANFSELIVGISSNYIAGGMETGQIVSNKTFLLELLLPVSVSEYKNTHVFNIYPNPVSDEVNLVFKSNKKRTVSVINSIGKEVLRLTNSTPTLQIDVSSYAIGVYIIKVESGQKVSSKKVIIQ